MKKSWHYLLLIGVFCSACASPDPYKRTKIRDGEAGQIVSHDSNFKNVFLINKKSGLKFCAEPEPDTAETIKDSVDESGGNAVTKEKVAVADTESTIALDGRTSTLLIAREVLYRACELGVNHTGTFEQQAKLFFHSLKAIERIVKASEEGQSTQRAPTSLGSPDFTDSQAGDTQSEDDSGK